LCLGELVVRFARLAIIVVTVSCFSADLAFADSKWSFKKLIPSFGKQDEPPRNLAPQNKEPSVWSKMNQGTKTFFAKTKDAVPPWLMPDTQARARESGSSFKRSSERMKEEAHVARRNFFAPWSQPKEPEKPESVSDWLGLDRPE
jgi:hypothetical protein